MKVSENVVLSSSKVLFLPLSRGFAACRAFQFSAGSWGAYQKSGNKPYITYYVRNTSDDKIWNCRRVYRTSPIRGDNRTTIVGFPYGNMWTAVD